LLDPEKFLLIKRGSSQPGAPDTQCAMASRVALSAESALQDGLSEFRLFLQSHPRFCGLSLHSILALEKAARRVDADKGSYIQHMGRDAGGIFILTQGIVEAVTVLPTGEEHLLALLHPGAMLGITAAFVPDRAVRRQNWLAHSDAVLWRIPIPDFRQCAAADPKVVDMVLAAMSARIQWLMDEVAAAAVLPAERKVIRCLLGVNEPPEPRSGHRADLLMVTHSKLALMLGLTRQSVAKVLRDLEARGLVRIERYRISVLSISALQAYGSQRGVARFSAADAS
jgi:CRP-like cAMP-binding protein